MPIESNPTHQMLKADAHVAQNDFERCEVLYREVCAANGPAHPIARLYNDGIVEAGEHLRVVRRMVELFEEGYKAGFEERAAGFNPEAFDQLRDRIASVIDVAEQSLNLAYETRNEIENLDLSEILSNAEQAESSADNVLDTAREALADLRQLLGEEEQ
jgi:hypothetical protein